MPSTSFTDIIKNNPNYMNPNLRDDELVNFTELCIEHILLSYVIDNQKMPADDIQTLLSIFCTLHNFRAFSSIAQIVIPRWSALGISSDEYDHIINANCLLFSTESPSHRIIVPYGLDPRHPNLVKIVLTLGKLAFNPQEILPNEVLEAILSTFDSQAIQTDSIGAEPVEPSGLNSLEEQLWDGVTSIDPGQLLEICEEDPLLLNKFLNKKRHEQNLQPDYMQRIFIHIIQAEDELIGGSNVIGSGVHTLLTFMDLLYKNIDSTDFQAQEADLVERFIDSNSLALLSWLINKVTDPMQQQKLENEISAIQIEIDDDSIDDTYLNRGNVSHHSTHFFSEPQTAACGLHLNDPKLLKIMLFLKQQGITQADILAMDADMLQGTLLSFGVTFNELTNPFKVKWITPQWQDAEFIDQYLLQFQTDLAKKNCGLMPSITDLETLDPAYIQAVVQGATGILRSTHISDGYFSTDAPRSFRHLLFPTCIDQVHFGLLVLHFDDKAESEGIFYFEPKKKRNFLNLATIFKDMKDVAKIQIPMDQIDDDFCGDYVISVIQGYANNLNPKIISWSEYKMNADSQLSKILADQHYSQFVGRALPIESIEYLRCDMAIQLGRTFVNYLNQRSLISEADFQEKVLPDIQKRHAELRNLKHIWQTTALVENDPRSDIDMHALKGSNLREKLLDYITTHEGTTKNSCLILDAEETISQKNQRGETCKLVALANAIEHTAYKTKPLNPPIPFIRTRRVPYHCASSQNNILAPWSVKCILLSHC